MVCPLHAKVVPPCYNIDAATYSQRWRRCKEGLLCRRFNCADPLLDAEAADALFFKALQAFGANTTSLVSGADRPAPSQPVARS